MVLKGFSMKFDKDKLQQIREYFRVETETNHRWEEFDLLAKMREFDDKISSHFEWVGLKYWYRDEIIEELNRIEKFVECKLEKFA
jgi:hypothetical protein